MSVCVCVCVCGGGGGDLEFSARVMGEMGGGGGGRVLIQSEVSY